MTAEQDLRRDGALPPPLTTIISRNASGGTVHEMLKGQSPWAFSARAGLVADLLERGWLHSQIVLHVGLPEHWVYPRRLAAVKAAGGAQAPKKLFVEAPRQPRAPRPAPAVVRHAPAPLPPRVLPRPQRPVPPVGARLFCERPSDTAADGACGRATTKRDAKGKPICSWCQEDERFSMASVAAGASWDGQPMTNPIAALHAAIEQSEMVIHEVLPPPSEALAPAPAMLEPAIVPEVSDIHGSDPDVHAMFPDEGAPSSETTRAVAVAMDELEQSTKHKVRECMADLAARVRQAGEPLLVTVTGAPRPGIGFSGSATITVGQPGGLPLAPVTRLKATPDCPYPSVDGAGRCPSLALERDSDDQPVCRWHASREGVAAARKAAVDAARAWTTQFAALRDAPELSGIFEEIEHVARGYAPGGQRQAGGTK